MLESVTRPDGNVVTFTYDALGRRLTKTFKKTTTHWIWDGNKPLHEWKTFESKDALTNNVITWIFNEYDYSPIAKLKNDKSYAILSDHLGTPVTMYNDQGQEVWSGVMDIYGRQKKESGEQGFCPYRFAGQYFDVETELCYNRFRYYSPEEGQYISQDPIGLAGNNPTLYGYVKDSNSFVDIFGLSECTVVKAKSRNDAIRQAKEHAKVPRKSRGGQEIEIDRLNDSSRGKNWEKMKANGGKKLGMENPNGKNYWFEHPDGHPDAGQPNIPKHHDSGHIHSVDSNGVEKIFTW
jgi:RHS repeat-associated protein